MLASKRKGQHEVGGKNKALRQVLGDVHAVALSPCSQRRRSKRAGAGRGCGEAALMLVS